MEYTDGSCCGDKHGHGALTAQASGWEIKEEIRGCARRGRRAGSSVPKRRKEREGVRYEGRGVRAERRPDAGKRRNAQCTKTASAARCRGHARMGS